jgi:histidine ammonia-lyase
VTVELRSSADFTLGSLRRVVIGREEVRLAMRPVQPVGRTPTRRRRAGHVPGSRIDTGGQQATASHDQRRFPAVTGPSAGATSMDSQYLPDRVARGVLFTWLAGLLAEGGRPQLARAEQVAALLNGPTLSLPRVAAADAWFLAAALSDLTGGDASWPTLSQAQALAPAALVADSALQASGRLVVAEGIFALAAEAYTAPLDAYDQALGAVWGDDPHDTAALSALQQWLTGAPSTARLSYQAPVSYRILPRVLGQAHRAVATAEQLSNSSPGWSAQDASLGSLHYALTGASALDALAAAWADLATLAGHQMAKLIDGSAPHLPAMLTAPATPASPGAHFSTWQAEYAIMQAECGEQARYAASSSFLALAETGGGPYSHIATPTLLAHEREQCAATSLSGSLAVLAAVASHALFITGRAAPPRLQALVRCIRDECPPVQLSVPAGSSERLLGLASVFEAAARDHAGPAARIQEQAVPPQ